MGDYSLGSVLSNKEVFSPYLRNAVKGTIVYPQQNHCLCPDFSFHSLSHSLSQGLIRPPGKQQAVVGNDGWGSGHLASVGMPAIYPHMQPKARKRTGSAWQGPAHIVTIMSVSTVMVIVTSLTARTNMYCVLNASTSLIAYQSLHTSAKADSIFCNLASVCPSQRG